MISLASFQLIMEGLGSPAHLPGASDEGRGSDPGRALSLDDATFSGRDLENELRVQLLTLQLVGNLPHD
jgi:hypothetical protein